MSPTLIRELWDKNEWKTATSVAARYSVSSQCQHNTTKSTRQRSALNDACVFNKSHAPTAPNLTFNLEPKCRIDDESIYSPFSSGVYGNTIIKALLLALLFLLFWSMTIWQLHDSLNHREVPSRVGWIQSMWSHGSNALFPVVIENINLGCLANAALRFDCTWGGQPIILSMGKIWQWCTGTPLI